nr:MAG TPA: hypothetical protein [Caudoviricetes sp.]
MEEEVCSKYLLYSFAMSPVPSQVLRNFLRFSSDNLNLLIKSSKPFSLFTNLLKSQFLVLSKKSDASLLTLGICFFNLSQIYVTLLDSSIFTTLFYYGILYINLENYI